MDESLLTGEPVPVRKIVGNDVDTDLTNVRPGGDDQPFLFSGTLVVSGHAVAKVLATGVHTEIGRIGQAL